MENKLLLDLNEQLKSIDVDSKRLDAIIQLKAWQKKMTSLIEQIYSNRMNDIDIMAANIEEEIKEKQSELERTRKKNTHTLLKLQHQIDELKPNIIVEQQIPDNLHELLERTIRVQCDDVSIDDDLVIIDIHKHEEKSSEKIYVVLPHSTANKPENPVSKLLTSEPVQQALAVGIVKTLTHVGTIAATNTTTVAATTMAKTALLTTACGLSTIAYGMAAIALGTTKKVCSFVLSSNS
ncbi:unnamed protein product [Adineta ricciae]|uniref:Uncharacterized protein n=1 Tax=Adineta ricciae TaxID=249248 RepID=A0A815S3W7_ADIRI|nr:unnamed protein product [Adineta ricciae]CAF1485732.1 unnamed protein product [Adineta ricciae]